MRFVSAERGAGGFLERASSGTSVWVPAQVTPGSPGAVTVVVQVSGVDDAGAAGVAAALELDVAQGSFFFRLAMRGLDVASVEVAALSTFGGSRVVDVTIESAIVLENLDVDHFNADAEAKQQFKKSIVAAVPDVTSADQIFDVRASAATRRRLVYYSEASVRRLAAGAAVVESAPASENASAI